MDTCYIINPLTGYHYDTMEAKFLHQIWEPELQSREYLEDLMKNDRQKFEGCVIVDTVDTSDVF